MRTGSKIAAKITKKEADYVIGLKGNQSILLDDVKLFFESFIDECTRTKTLEKGHVSERKCFALLCVFLLWNIFSRAKSKCCCRGKNICVCKIW